MRLCDLVVVEGKEGGGGHGLAGSCRCTVPRAALESFAACKDSVLVTAPESARLQQRSSSRPLLISKGMSSKMNEKKKQHASHERPMPASLAVERAQVRVS